MGGGAQAFAGLGVDFWGGGLHKVFGELWWREVREETEIFLLEEKMPKCVLGIVRWFAGAVGFGFKHKL